MNSTAQSSAPSPVEDTTSKPEWREILKLRPHDKIEEDVEVEDDKIHYFLISGPEPRIISFNAQGEPGTCTEKWETLVERSLNSGPQF